MLKRGKKLGEVPGTGNNISAKVGPLAERTRDGGD